LEKVHDKILLERDNLIESNSETIDFAFIGHLENWTVATEFVNSIRFSGLNRLTEEKVKQVFPFIPPRKVFSVKVNSITGSEIKGAYIESFLDPDKLGLSSLRDNISKVKQSMDCAKKLGAGIVTLGGFTSIVLEGNIEVYSSAHTSFSTGNTLTAAYIVKGIEKASDLLGFNLKNSNVLIIGATGDIGQACTHYLKSKVGKLLLSARNINRLEKLAGQLSMDSIPFTYSSNLDDLIPYSDVIICTASSSNMIIRNCKEGVLICDSGYPKNLDSKIEDCGKLYIYHGGMGIVKGGFKFIPDYSRSFYRFPLPHISHGCILEAMILAFENLHVPYSVGKGFITVKKMESIYSMGLKHGIDIAPFYNNSGLWK
jgi:predicted amino acid dehydrogenase